MFDLTLRITCTDEDSLAEVFDKMTEKLARESQKIGDLNVTANFCSETYNGDMTLKIDDTDFKGPYFVVGVLMGGSRVKPPAGSVSVNAAFNNAQTMLPGLRRFGGNPFNFIRLEIEDRFGNVAEATKDHPSLVILPALETD